MKLQITVTRTYEVDLVGADANDIIETIEEKLEEQSDSDEPQKLADATDADISDAAIAALESDPDLIIGDTSDPDSETWNVEVIRS